MFALMCSENFKADFLKMASATPASFKNTSYPHFCCCWVETWFKYYYHWSLLYSAVLRSRADSLRSHVILHEWIAFYCTFLNIHEVVCLQRWHGWCHMKLLPSQRVLCTPYNHAPCHFMQSHIRKVYACLAVTCHLYFWQNDRGLLHATVVNIKIMSQRGGAGGWHCLRHKGLS